MADRWQAQYDFWSSFNLPAFNENTSIEANEQDVPYPHLTYLPNGGSFDVPFQTHASLWYRSESWKDISQKADEIEEYIGQGITLPIDDGIIWIKPPTSVPFAQPMASGQDDKQIKRIYLTVEVEIINTMR